MRKRQFTRSGFYFRQSVWLASAMLVGWLGLVLFPGFVRASTQAVGSGWRSLGLGVAVLAGVPGAIVSAALPPVCLPLPPILFPSFLPSVYLTKSWSEAFSRRRL